MKILGLSAFYHDSAASILIDGEIVSAIQEERLTRIKHDSSFPQKAIQKCLEDCQLQAGDIDHIIFYEKPFLKFERLLETYLQFAPRGYISFMKALPLWLDEKLFQKKSMQKQLKSMGFRESVVKKMLFADHHLSHAASAFYPSPFNEALVLTMDGVGEWTTTSVYVGKGNKLEKKKEIIFPHSLGLLYSAFTYHCGFKVNSGEYKLMGLAPYGEPKYAGLIKEKLIDIKADGSFRLNMDYFDYCTGLTMTNDKFDNLFQNSRRSAEEELKAIHLDLAASIQSVLEEVILKLVSSLKTEFGQKNLCLAGGVALNCVANGRLYREGLFENLWIQPAAGDAGGALGAALVCHYDYLKADRKVNPDDDMKGCQLGNSFTDHQIENDLQRLEAQFEKMEEEKLLSTLAAEISGGAAVGWFHGKMEFGPRALGNRSIIADPRNADTQKVLNLKIKFRESFRPFAPAILEEHVGDYFEYKDKSPYMMIVAPVRAERRYKIENDQNLFGLDRLYQLRSDVPAITHVDYSARLQTVSAKTNSKFHRLLKKFKELTGCPLLVNTSFNIRGEPIVCTPEDAYRCFMGTDLDILVLENFLLYKKHQPEKSRLSYQHKFELD